MASTLTHMPTLLGIMLIGRLFECAPGGEDFAVGLNAGDRPPVDSKCACGVQIGSAGCDRINAQALGFFGAYGRPCFGRLVEQPHAAVK